MGILATFEEEELSRLYTDVAVGGDEFETAIVGNARAVQQRTVNRYDPVRSYEIQFGGLTQPERDRLNEFFITKRGRAVGFRFYPPNDRNFQNDVIGIGDGSNHTFYFKRNYRSRSIFYSRRIVKPVKDTVVVTVDGVAASGTVDWDQGVIVLTAAPTAGAIVRCESGQYDVPVFFNVDKFNTTDYGPFADWNSITVVEILPTNFGAAGDAISPLALAFTAPHSNEFFATSFDVSLTHTGVTKVYLYVNGSLAGTDTSSPFSFTGVSVPTTTEETFLVKALGVNTSGDFVEAQIELRTVPAPTGAIEIFGSLSGVSEIDAGYWL